LCVKNKQVGVDGTQQDASEFLISLMDIFHNAISRSANIILKVSPSGAGKHLYIECYERVKQLYSANYSDIIKIFYGMTVTEIIDKTTSEILSRTFDPFFVLNVSILHTGEYVSIHDCLKTIFGVEILEKENKWFNPISNKYQDVIKHTQMWNIPSVLIINIKKYTSTQKIHGIIDIPHILDVSTYLHQYSSGIYTYQLYGVCNHIGDMNGGHYYAFVYIEEIHSWIMLNDDKPPCKIPESEVISQHAVGVLYRICRP
jgi:ubiquitin C-terminal hydrolase